MKSGIWSFLRFNRAVRDCFAFIQATAQPRATAERMLYHLGLIPRVAVGILLVAIVIGQIPYDIAATISQGLRWFDFFAVAILAFMVWKRAAMLEVLVFLASATVGERWPTLSHLERARTQAVVHGVLRVFFWTLIGLLYFAVMPITVNLYLTMITFAVFILIVFALGAHIMEPSPFVDRMVAIALTIAVAVVTAKIGWAGGVKAGALFVSDPFWMFANDLVEPVAGLALVIGGIYHATRRVSAAGKTVIVTFTGNVAIALLILTAIAVAVGMYYPSYIVRIAVWTVALVLIVVLAWNGKKFFAIAIGAGVACWSIAQFWTTAFDPVTTAPIVVEGMHRAKAMSGRTAAEWYQKSGRDEVVAAADRLDTPVIQMQLHQAREQQRILLEWAKDHCPGQRFCSTEQEAEYNRLGGQIRQMEAQTPTSLSAPTLSITSVAPSRRIATSPTVVPSQSTTSVEPSRTFSSDNTLDRLYTRLKRAHTRLTEARREQSAD